MHFDFGKSRTSTIAKSPCHCIIGRQRKKEKNTAIVVLCIAWNLFCFWCFHFNIFSIAVHSLIHSYVYNLHARGTSRQILFLICFYIFKRLWLAWFWQDTDWALSNAVGREVGWYSKTRGFPAGSPFPPSSPLPSLDFHAQKEFRKQTFSILTQPESRLAGYQRACMRNHLRLKPWKERSFP